MLLWISVVFLSILSTPIGEHWGWGGIDRVAKHICWAAPKQRMPLVLASGIA